MHDDQPDLAVLADLARTIAARRGADRTSSYTAQLLADGVERCARKFGEEAVEVIVAALRTDDAAMAAEGADLLYHFLVLLEARGVPLDDVLKALRKREGQGGLAEKAARNRALD
ncbi:MAG: phosphoribosyl-ATP diphosphatase [Hyphomicrobiales bacterium]